MTIFLPPDPPEGMHWELQPDGSWTLVPDGKQYIDHDDGSWEIVDDDDVMAVHDDMRSTP